MEKKDQEIEKLDDDIEELEERIMDLDALKKLEDGATKKSKKIQAAESRFAFELEDKDKEIRKLKNNMGFLRKDYTSLQQEFEKFKNSVKNSSVIRVEELRTKTPLNALVKDLQDKVNKQRSTIIQLQSQNVENSDLIEKLKDKDDEIEIFKKEIMELNQKLKDFSSSTEGLDGDSITKKLIEDLQQELNKSKSKIVKLKQKISKSNKKSKKELKESSSLKIKELENQVNDFKKLLEGKDLEIEKLKSNLIPLQNSGISTGLKKKDATSDEMIDTLKADLQNKLNRAKLQITSLQKQLQQYQSGKTPVVNKNQTELEGSLKMQREMAMFLQKQLENKEGEIETIKNEAVQIKTRYRQLENQLRLKEQNLIELQQRLDAKNVQIQVQPNTETSDINLRLGELKNMIDELRKENIEQKLEISELRKKS